MAEGRAGSQRDLLAPLLQPRATKDSASRQQRRDDLLHALLHEGRFLGADPFADGRPSLPFLLDPSSQLQLALLASVICCGIIKLLSAQRWECCFHPALSRLQPQTAILRLTHANHSKSILYSSYTAQVYFHATASHNVGKSIQIMQPWCHKR